MASRLRPPAGSKLVRPVPTGTGLRPLGGAKPSGGSHPNSQSAGGYEREGPPMTRTTPIGGLRKPGGPARPSSQTRATSQEKPVQQASNGTATPGFGVGDHVLVGGVKPGVIAFLGPTQFAKGTWAGVVLDTTEGKNNGSVNGVQYFMCEPNRGLFAKPEKLEFVSRGTANSAPQKTPLSRSQAAGGDGSSYTFQVGDRVMVDGVKPGVVGFYGEVEFARGIWAGIILDAREGKNNGCVGGVQYFQCENNHGLFTRPQKLTLVESTSSMNSHAAQIPSVQQVTQTTSRTSSQERSRPGSMVDPAQIKALREKLKLGDHVLVGGVKEGVLRFIGTTEFAKGIWAGVELAEPLGKNDGAVSGKRYFHCPLKHGLFAPLPKVEKLASAASSSEKSTPPGPSAISSTASLTPPSTVHSSPPGTIKIPRGMEKGVAIPIIPLGGRRPSESSTSSIGVAQDYMLPSLQGTTSAGLSHFLQEKDQRIKSLEQSLEDREKEGANHQEELTELRRQVDDLQFQLEEQGIISGDKLETATESNEHRLVDISIELERERESNTRLREELESFQRSRERGGIDGSSELRGQLTEAQAQLGERTSEVTTHLQTITQLRTEVASAETVSHEATSKLAEMTSSLVEKTEELEKVLSQFKESQNTITDYQRRLKTSEERCELVEAQKGELEGQIDQLSQMSGDSSQQLSYLTEQLREKERQVEDLKSGLVSLMDKEQQKSAELDSVKEQLKTDKQQSGQVEKELSAAEKAASELQMELNSTSKELGEALDLCSQHEVLIEERNSELNGLEAQIRTLTKEREIWGNEKSRLQSEQDRLAGERDRAIAECDRLMAHNQTSSDEQNELSRQRRELLAERDTILAQQQAMQTEHDKLLGEREELQRQLMDIHQQRQDALGASQEITMKFDSTQQELSQALAEVQDLKLRLSISKDELEHEKLRLQEELELSRADLTDHQQRLDNATHERDSALQQAQDMADKLDVVQIERDQLQQELESAQNQADELQFQFEELNSRHQYLESETNAESSVIQQHLENAEAVLAERERELAEEREMVNTLTQDLIASQSKHDQAMLEEEKQLLEERVKELTEQLEKPQQKAGMERLTTQVSVESNNRLEEAQSQLLESQVEIETLQQTITDHEQQTDFLNSVISDLQRKLEMAEAMAGLHGPLEAGTNSDYADDEDMVQGLPPPRLFCDICDVFDQHDTDDCPMQAASDSPPPSMHHGKRAPGGSDRPYCDSCEVFGHWTEDCQYDVTY